MSSAGVALELCEYTNAKAFFRRAKAQMALGAVAEAVDDVE